MSLPVVYGIQSDEALRRSAVVSGMQATLLDPQIILKHATMSITEPAINDKNTPKREGVFDHRMGVVARHLACGLCGRMVDSCPGHMGCIQLNRPVYHVHYIEDVLKVLRCLCFWCGRFLMPEPWPHTPCGPDGECTEEQQQEHITMKGKQMSAMTTATGGGRAARGKVRLNMALAAVRRGKARKVCHDCKGAQPEYKIPKGASPLVIRTDWKNANITEPEEREKTLKPFTAKRALKILRMTPLQDYVRMGCDPVMSHPSWLIITVLPVPPPIVRPSITDTEGSRSRGQDDLTRKLKSIVLANNAIGYHKVVAMARAFEREHGASAILGSAATAIGSSSSSSSSNGNSSTAAVAAVVAAAMANAPPSPVSGESHQPINVSVLLQAWMTAVREGIITDEHPKNALGLPILLPYTSNTLVSAINKATAASVAALEMDLQVEIATYHDNDIRGQKQATARSGKPTAGLFKRLRGKDGRMRGYLLGKRVNFTARAVITPDPEIDIDQIGVPYEIAKTLTYPERVTRYSRDQLTQRVRAGPDALKGAKTVIDLNRRTIYLESRDAHRQQQQQVSRALGATNISSYGSGREGLFDLGGSGGKSGASIYGGAGAAGDAPVISYMATGPAAAQPDGPCTGSAWRSMIGPKGASRVVGADRAPPLQYGMIVERHLKDGDHVMINRQPSLHKGSMMAHRTYIMPGRTMRLNLSAASPYNADFDGDEMNMHVPQSEGARAEVCSIMNVAQQTVSPQSNKPIIGLVMDALVGSCFLTANNVFLEKHEMMQLVTAMHYDAVGRSSRFVLPPPAILKPKPLWTGKQLYSVLIPGALNLERRVRDLESDKEALVWPARDRRGNAIKGETWINPYMPRSLNDERIVVVQSGELLSGMLCKQTVGATAASLVHVIFKDFGWEAIRRFLSDAQRVVNRWLSWRGFSVGIEDCIADPQTRKRVDNVIDCTLDSIKAFSEFSTKMADPCDGDGDDNDKQQHRERGRARKKRANNNNNNNDNKGARGTHGRGRPGKRAHLDENEREAYASRLTNKVMGHAGDIVQSHTTMHNNSVRAMITAQSKGSVFNATQMSGCVGQQCVEGRRIHSDSGSRTMACFRHAQAVLLAASCGFVRNSFERGLDFVEMYFHMMGGREGIVDTAVKTAETGYIQRRCIKSMESLQVKDNGRVLNANGEIVQFAYGGDGIDATFIERVRCRAVRMTSEEILRKCDWRVSSLYRRRRRALAYDHTAADASQPHHAWIQCPHATMDTLVQPSTPLSCAIDAATRDDSPFDQQHDYVPLSTERPQSEIVAPNPIHRCPVLSDACPWSQASVSAVARREAQRIEAARAQVVFMKSSLLSAGGSDDDQLFVPIHVARLVETVCRRTRNMTCVRGPMSPLELEQEVNAVCDTVLSMTAGAGCAPSGDASQSMPPLRGTAGLRLVLATELRSRVLVRNWGITWTMWEALRDEIIGGKATAGRYLKSLAAPGEMVGAIAAQSIGEPSTQMSIIYEERLLVFDAHQQRLRIVTIGDLVEQAIMEGGDLVEHDPVHDTTHVGIGDRLMMIPAVDTHGTVRWRRVTGATRHPPNGSLVVVRTRTGRRVTATLAKSFLTLDKDGHVVPINGSDLTVGMPLPVNRLLPRVPGLPDAVQWAHSCIDGAVRMATADETQTGERRVTIDPHRPSRLAGCLSGDAVHVDGAHHAPATRSSDVLPLDADLLLGVASWVGAGDRVWVGPARADGEQTMDGTLAVGGAVIGAAAAAADRTYARLAKDGDDQGDVFWDPIVTIERWDDHGRDHVYDLSVEHDANFSLLNGLQMRDTLRTFHFAGWGAKNVTLGVPRLREIIDATVMKRPCVTLYLDQDQECTRDAAAAVCRLAEHASLASLVESHCIERFDASALAARDCIGGSAAWEDVGGCASATPLYDNNDNDVGKEPTAARGDMYATDPDDGVHTDDAAFARACSMLFSERQKQQQQQQHPSDAQAFGSSRRPLHLGPTDSIKHTTAGGTDGTTNRAKARENRTNADADAGCCPQQPPHQQQKKRYHYMVRYLLNRAETEARGLLPRDVARCVARALAGTGLERVTHGEPSMDMWFIEVVFHDLTALFTQFRASLQSTSSSSPTASETGTKDGVAASDALMPPPPARPRSRASRQTAGGGGPSQDQQQPPRSASEIERWERASLAALQTPFMLSVHVAGIKDVSRAVPSETTSPRTTGGKPEWTVEVEGSALSDLLALPGVDPLRSHSNDILRVASVLGIEAAMAVLFAEIKAVISFDGTYVNDRHFALAADTMCYHGSVVAMTRHGINKGNHGFLARASFEETLDILFDAAAFAETDRVTKGSVTEPIILGQAAPIGTALSDVIRADWYKWQPPGASTGPDGSSSSLVDGQRTIVTTTTTTTTAPYEGGTGGHKRKLDATTWEREGGMVQTHPDKLQCANDRSARATTDRSGADGTDNPFAAIARQSDSPKAHPRYALIRDDDEDDMEIADLMTDPDLAAHIRNNAKARKVPRAHPSTPTTAAAAPATTLDDGFGARDCDDGLPRYAPPSPSRWLLGV